jgi:hypothetical protein
MNGLELNNGLPRHASGHPADAAGAVVDVEDGCLYFACPHCGGGVVVLESEVNCRIFRHGVMRDGSGGVPPHAPREQCDAMVAGDAVYGCARPFELIPVGREFVVRACEYV